MAKKSTKTWMYAPKKPPKGQLSDDLKAAVQVQASELVEKVLKPQHVQPPPQEPRFNYVVDMWSKWQGSYFYFGATYACPGPNAIEPTFETKLARMAYLGGKHFAVAYLRHTEKWFTIFPSLTLADCLEAIEGGGPFES